MARLLGRVVLAWHAAGNTTTWLHPWDLLVVAIRSMPATLLDCLHVLHPWHILHSWAAPLQQACCCAPALLFQTHTQVLLHGLAGTGSCSYPLTSLQAGVAWPPDVDPSQREAWLSGAEFQRVFGMAFVQYQALPSWKKTQLKKQHGLF